MTIDLAALFREHHDSLVRVLFRRTGDRDRAEDIAQETFARAVAAPPRNPRPWLFAVALNLVREDGRKAVRQGRRLELYRAETPHFSPAADQGLERSDNVRAVQEALATLPELAPWLSAGDRVVVAGSRIAIRIDSTGLTEWRGDRLATTVQYFRQ